MRTTLENPHRQMDTHTHMIMQAYRGACQITTPGTRGSAPEQQRTFLLQVFEMLIPSLRVHRLRHQNVERVPRINTGGYAQSEPVMLCHQRSGHPKACAYLSANESAGEWRMTKAQGVGSH